MNCAIVYETKGWPVAVTVNEKDGYLIFDIKGQEVKVLKENLERVLAFFK